MASDNRVDMLVDALRRKFSSRGEDASQQAGDLSREAVAKLGLSGGAAQFIQNAQSNARDTAQRGNIEADLLGARENVAEAGREKAFNRQSTFEFEKQKRAQQFARNQLLQQLSARASQSRSGQNKGMLGGLLKTGLKGLILSQLGPAGPALTAGMPGLDAGFMKLFNQGAEPQSFQPDLTSFSRDAMLGNMQGMNFGNDPFQFDFNQSRTQNR